MFNAKSLLDALVNAGSQAGAQGGQAGGLGGVLGNLAQQVQQAGGAGGLAGMAGQIFGQTVAAKAAEITGGKLTIDYHPNGDLGGDTDLLRQAQSGDLDIVVCQTAPTVSFIPEMAVFDLPMVFAKYDGETIDKVLNGENDFSAALGSAYEKAGLHLLGFLQNATYRLTTANVALNTLAEVATTEYSRQTNPTTMEESKRVAREGGSVAREARETMEKRLGRSVVSKERASDYIIPENKKVEELPFEEIKDNEE